MSFMKKAWRVRKFVALAALSAVGCKTRSDLSDATVKADDGSAAATASASLTFRNTLFGYLASAYPNDYDAMKDFVAYMPTDGLLQAAASPASNAEDLLGAMDKAMNDERPAALYQLGKQTPSSPTATAELNAALAAQPVTLVIIPGVFGEFIEARAFEEIFAAGDTSVFGQEWRKKLADYRAKGAAGGNDVDAHYSLQDLGPVDAGLDELLSVGSIDSGGQALVRVVLFNTPQLSLESLGDSALLAPIFSRRLSKFFAITGTPNNVVLVGYSRGAMIGLDMLASGADTGWQGNVRGMVALGGVVFGSALADAVDDPASKTAKESAALVQLRDGLQEKNSAFFGNTKKWAVFLATMAKLEGSGSWADSIGSAVGQIRGTDVAASSKMIGKYWSEFGLNKPGTEYVANIQRFKKLATEVETAVTGLKTSSRLAWWRSHKIPVNTVRYYNIAGTMDDEKSSALGDTLIHNPYTYDPEAADQKSLVSSYNDFIQASGSYLNDSQVAPLRTTFAPQLIFALSGQKVEHSSFLGIVGVHHWGLALPVVNKMKDGKTNPFPRPVLLQAIAATVARDLATGSSPSAP